MTQYHSLPLWANQREYFSNVLLAQETVEVEETVSVEQPQNQVSDDPRVVKVAGHVLRLPRLPFFGCEDVTVNDHRAVIEEIIRNPEQE